MRNMDVVEEYLRKLAARARLESAPQVDVASSVLALVRERGRARELVETPLSWVAFGSASAAAITAVLAFQAVGPWGDAILDVFCLVTGGIP